MRFSAEPRLICQVIAVNSQPAATKYRLAGADKKRFCSRRLELIFYVSYFFFYTIFFFFLVSDSFSWCCWKKQADSSDVGVVGVMRARGTKDEAF